MNFYIIGWNYRQTPIEIREQFATPFLKSKEFAEQLKQLSSSSELAILATCNRIEVYFSSSDSESSAKIIVQEMVKQCGVEEAYQLHYKISNLGAVEHLIRVTSGLESMIIGEAQISGQVKEAYQASLEYDHAGSLFKNLFPKAFVVAKRIRSETQISKLAVSVSFAAVELAKQIFENLADCSVLIIGAGEMAELAVKHFIKCHVSRILMTNRTAAAATKLAESLQGVTIPFQQIAQYLPQVDIVISSTGAPSCIITSDMVKQGLKIRKGKPLFFVDIAVPRDVEPEVNQLTAVYCYDIDSLQNVVDCNLNERQAQVASAQKIILQELENLRCWFKTFAAAPYISSLRESFHEIGVQELERALTKMSTLSEQDKEKVQHLVYSLINKLLHKPCVNLRQLSERIDGQDYLDLINRLFELLPMEEVHESQKQHSFLQAPKSCRPYALVQEEANLPYGNQSGFVKKFWQTLPI